MMVMDVVEMICIFLLLCLIGILAKLIHDLQEDFEQMHDEMEENEQNAAPVYAIRALKEELFELKNRFDAFENGALPGTEELEKLLDKKWNDAIQSISNFDPFGEESK